MNKLPEEVKKLWDEHEGAVVFSTVDSDGTPNSIYATCTGLFEESKIIIANNYFDKTMTNIKNGSRGSAVFINADKKSCQVKGSIEYYTEGPVFDFMKSWNPEKHPGHGAAALNIESVYSGSEKLL